MSKPKFKVGDLVRITQETTAKNVGYWGSPSGDKNLEKGVFNIFAVDKKSGSYYLWPGVKSPPKSMRRAVKVKDAHMYYYFEDELILDRFLMEARKVRV